MTKGEYPYPPDEFDVVEPSDGPRGVHRRPRGAWATLWPYLVTLVASALLAVVVIGLVWGDDGAAPDGDAGAGDTVAEVTETTEPAAPTETAATPTAEPEPAPEPAPVAPPVAEPAPPPVPDLATPVAVFNSTSVQGLAAEAAETLEDEGWTRVEAANFTGGSLRSSTVRYGAPELEVSARAVADVLGITTVELAESDAVEGIEVVLELDFTG